MSNPNNPNDRTNDRNLDDTRPDVATDARAAARQEQVKADHAALEESARRVESSVGAGLSTTPVHEAATDPAAAAKQDQIKADRDALQESARRVESSVPADVRNTPVQQANDTVRSIADSTVPDDARSLREALNAVEERERDRR